MQGSKWMAAALAAMMCTASHAQLMSENGDASQTVVSMASVLVALPFALVISGSEHVEHSLASLGNHTHWTVTDLKEQGAKTDVGMRSDDDKFKLTITVPTPQAHAQHIGAGDKVDIDRVGTTGYTVKKGKVTLGVLAQPGAVHSSARE